MPCAGGHGLPCPALREGFDAGDSRNRPADGRQPVSAAARRAGKGAWRRAQVLLHGRPHLLRPRPRADHPVLHRVHPHRRGLLELLHVLRDSENPRPVPLPPRSRHPPRNRKFGQAGREGAYPRCAGHVALRHGLRRRIEAGGADAEGGENRRRGLAARPLLLSGGNQRAAAGHHRKHTQYLQLC